ncbi:MAG: hypothetical protein C0514_08825 [Candidatus Puniceispirillum sp.]|nr:hypothetical protein [Candidatus Puniceispirillum sp.]
MGRTLFSFMCLVMVWGDELCWGAMDGVYGQVEAALKAQFDKDTLGARSEKERQVIDVYKKRSFQPLWLTPSGWGGAVPIATGVLKNADREGLEPKDYARLLKDVEALPETFEGALKAEINLTRAVLDYIDDLGGERFNPHAVVTNVHLKPDSVDAAAVLIEGFAADPTGAWLEHHTLPVNQYQNLKKLLADLRAKQKDQGNQVLLSADGPSLKKGMTSPDVAKVRAALQARGFDAGEGNTFDAALEAAVKAYQEDAGLDGDGMVGPQTRRLLSKGLQDRINQVIVNMERWRWMPARMPQRYLFVNIATFTLQGFDGGKEILAMPVIIGRDYRKTPIFSSVVDSVRFNPSWNVPRSIAVKDKLPKLRVNPSYFVDKGYVITDDSGSEVDPHSVDWDSVSASDFSYHIRQRPGSANALGKIRFNVESPFDVYLHDTSEPALFAKKVRTFSSGCIRVSQPAKLGEFVFNDPSQWTQETVASSMKGNETRNVRPREATPIFITYFTVWAPDGEKPQFKDDVYNQDAQILAAIQRRTQA